MNGTHPVYLLHSNWKLFYLLQCCARLLAPTSSVSKEMLVSASRSSLSSIRAMNQIDPVHVMGPPMEAILRNEEKRYLLMVERGDYNGVRK